jgi:hypothetical protein
MKEVGWARTTSRASAAGGAGNGAALAPKALSVAARNAWDSAFSGSDANAWSTLAGSAPVFLSRSRIGPEEEEVICRWTRMLAKAECLPLPDSGNGRLAR